ncbi:hypothetical protein GGS21DRAFT_506204 [Xylaria nigripes]|nr:hypothetical protein GGS21DRAFT_506204 [Xylaria nigripes]
MLIFPVATMTLLYFLMIAPAIAQLTWFPTEEKQRECGPPLYRFGLDSVPSPYYALTPSCHSLADTVNTWVGFWQSDNWTAGGLHDNLTVTLAKVKECQFSIRRYNHKSANEFR